MYIPVLGVGALTSKKVKVYIGGQECKDVSIVRDYTVKCKVPPKQQDNDALVFVSVDDVPSISHLFYKYTLPGDNIVIGQVTPFSGPIAGGTEISAMVYIAGANGVPPDDSGVSITVGGITCGNVKGPTATSNKELFKVSCTVPPSAVSGPQKVKIVFMKNDQAF